MSASAEYDFLKNNTTFKTLVAKARLNAYPCSANPKNREFDFWIGEWNVFQTATNFQVGKSRIDDASGGCLILENWTAVGNPDEGKSMNILNTKTGKWEQLYMGAGGNALRYYNGAYKDGAMRFDGDGTDAKGNKQLFHLSYTNESSGDVRQLLEVSADNGKIWTTVYDFTYKKIK